MARLIALKNRAARDRRVDAKRKCKRRQTARPGNISAGALSSTGFPSTLYACVASSNRQTHGEHHDSHRQRQVHGARATRHLQRGDGSAANVVPRRRDDGHDAAAIRRQPLSRRDVQCPSRACRPDRLAAAPARAHQPASLGRRAPDSAGQVSGQRAIRGRPIGLCRTRHPEYAQSRGAAGRGRRPHRHCRAVVGAEGLNPHHGPKPPEIFSPAWHLDVGFGNFAEAWTYNRGAGMRIAHLDTGHTPSHMSTPRGLLPNQGYNFSEDNTNTVDPYHAGGAYMPGHGTATLALLAGDTVDIQYLAGPIFNDDIGGAPDASVVPVRIGPSVIHLYSAAMAQGLDYALAPRERRPLRRRLAESWRTTVEGLGRGGKSAVRGGHRGCRGFGRQLQPRGHRCGDALHRLPFGLLPRRHRDRRDLRQGAPISPTISAPCRAVGVPTR